MRNTPLFMESVFGWKLFWLNNNYGQPANRHLQNLNDLGFPVSPGTLAGGLQALMPLFEPVIEALYVRQMDEKVFHNV